MKIKKPMEPRNLWYPARCVICNKFSRRMSSVGWWGDYGWMGKYNYHYSCVRDAIQNPEKYGNQKVDMALKIHQCLEYHWDRYESGRKQQEQFRNSELRRLQGMI